MNQYGAQPSVFTKYLLSGHIDGYFAQSRRLYPRRFTPRGFASSIEWGDTY
jgi:hypothetical protein